MIHAVLSDEQRELAALYALGSLAAEETRAFADHLDQGCSACRAEVEAFGAVTDALALATPPAPPRALVRTRLLDAVRRERAGRDRLPFAFVTQDEGSWREVLPGLSRKDLLTEQAGVASTSYLLRLDPGARAPTHRHSTVEHCFVLSGDLHIAGRLMHGGDYHVAMPESLHEEPYTENGCLLLIVDAPAPA